MVGEFLFNMVDIVWKKLRDKVNVKRDKKCGIRDGKLNVFKGSSSSLKVIIRSVGKSIKICLEMLGKV